jgi:hypothetical protein
MEGNKDIVGIIEKISRYCYIEKIIKEYHKYYYYEDGIWNCLFYKATDKFHCCVNNRQLYLKYQTSIYRIGDSKIVATLPKNY